MDAKVLGIDPESALQVVSEKLAHDEQPSHDEYRGNSTGPLYGQQPERSDDTLVSLFSNLVGR